MPCFSICCFVWMIAVCAARRVTIVIRERLELARARQQQVESGDRMECIDKIMCSTVAYSLLLYTIFKWTTC